MNSISTKLSVAIAILTKIRHYVKKDSSVYFGICSSILTYTLHNFRDPVVLLYKAMKILKLSDNIRTNNHAHKHIYMHKCISNAHKHTERDSNTHMHVSICMHTHMNIHPHARTPTHVHTCICTHMLTHPSTLMHRHAQASHMHTCTHAHLHKSTHKYTHTNKLIYML